MTDNANALPIQARLRGSVAAAAQAYTDAWFSNPGTARPVHCIPAKETDTDLVLAQGIKDAAERIDALEKALREIRDWRKSCHEYDNDAGHKLREFDVEDLRMMEFCARAALGEGQ